MAQGYRTIVVAAAFTIASVVLGAGAAYADTWRGTAPFCSGKCLPGEQQIATSKTGDGSSCWSGHKVLCRNNDQTCFPHEVETECALFVLICDNGCSSYACGGCIFSED